MESIEFQVDDETLDRLQRMAESRQCSVEELLTKLVGEITQRVGEADPLTGLLADEPELLNEVLSSALAARENHPLRQTPRG